MKQLNLSGKTALVTGGNLGIGRAIVLSLAQCGADVAFTYYSHKSEGEETAREVLALGRKAPLFHLDATDGAQVKKVANQAASALGGQIDILINNAGHLVGRSTIAEMSDEHWFKTINVNLTSTFYVTRAVLPFMSGGWGRIVNMSSLAAHNGGGPGAVAYAASKAAVITFTRGFSKEVAGQGITVNAVAPGLILETPFHETFNTDEGIRGAINATPLNRGGTPEDVANTVLYFASDLGSFITGETAEINGGLHFA
ncbi:MAG: SDR family oxidoreductase [Desulfobulbaceae bacterium]|nr:MAG: SDR family oxidoreductase [Desulfobulbaceae bacterium]